MAIDFTCYLYSESERRGRSLFVGNSGLQRYAAIPSGRLQASGLYGSVRSVEILQATGTDAEVMSFFSDDFSGEFEIEGLARDATSRYWNVRPGVRSVLLGSVNRDGWSETRVSFRDRFADQWKAKLDGKLGGSRAQRAGEPVFTWEMFPFGIDSLDVTQTYVKIFQPLTVKMPGPLSDYAASMTYHFFLFLDGAAHLRCAGVRWAFWVESGAKNSDISNELRPQVIAGLSEVASEINSQLTTFDIFGPFTSVYLLPGKQLVTLGTSWVTGHTATDVTVVVEKGA